MILLTLNRSKCRFRARGVLTKPLENIQSEPNTKVRPAEMETLEFERDLSTWSSVLLGTFMRFDSSSRWKTYRNPFRSRFSVGVEKVTFADGGNGKSYKLFIILTTFSFVNHFLENFRKNSWKWKNQFLEKFFLSLYQWEISRKLIELFLWARMLVVLWAFRVRSQGRQISLNFEATDFTVDIHLYVVKIEFILASLGMRPFQK